MKLVKLADEQCYNRYELELNEELANSIEQEIKSYSWCKDTDWTLTLDMILDVARDIDNFDFDSCEWDKEFEYGFLSEWILEALHSRLWLNFVETVSGEIIDAEHYIEN